MNQERLLKVLLPACVREGARGRSRQTRWCSSVATDATKPEIKGAVEMLFNVKVRSVSVANVKGKAKRFGAMQGRRSDRKKVYVCRRRPGNRLPGQTARTAPNS